VPWPFEMDGKLGSMDDGRYNHNYGYNYMDYGYNNNYGLWITDYYRLNMMVNSHNRKNNQWIMG
jgi:hypothetical protein